MKNKNYSKFNNNIIPLICKLVFHDVLKEIKQYSHFKKVNVKSKKDMFSYYAVKQIYNLLYSNILQNHMLLMKMKWAVMFIILMKDLSQKILMCKF